MLRKITMELIALLVGGTYVFAQDSIPMQTDSTALSVILQEVIVTATGTEHHLKDVPVQTEVIGKKIIEGLGASSVSDILQNLVPSISFNKTEMGSGIQMNGLGNSYILIMVDGKKLHGDNGGQNSLDFINPNSIERIEIVKGASSALYGSNAIAGVINIITKKQKERLVVENNTRYASYNGITQSNFLKFGLSKRLQASTTVYLKHTDGWQNTKEERPDKYERHIKNSVNKTVNEYTSYRIQQRLDYKHSKMSSLYLTIGYYNKNIYRPKGIPDYKAYDFIYKDWNSTLGGKHKFHGNNHIEWNVNFDTHGYYYKYNQEYFDSYYEQNVKKKDYFIPGDIERNSLQLRAMSNVKAVVNLPRMNRLSLGADFQWDGLKAPKRLDRKNVGTYTTALYAQDEKNFGDNLNVTAGLRLTHNDEFGFHLTPQLSTLYTLGNLNIRLAYSEGFKSPTPKQKHYRYIRDMGGVNLYVGNPNLKPETSRYISGGIEWNGSRVSLSAIGYFNKISNMITLVNINPKDAPKELIVEYDPRRVREYNNMNRAETYGAEINVKFLPISDVILTASYTYLDTDAHFYNKEEEVMENVIIDGTSHNRAKFSMIWRRRLSKSMTNKLSLFGNYQSKAFYQNDGNGKAYQIWRLNNQLEIKRKKNYTLKLNIGVDNIFDYYETTYHGLNYGTKTPGRTFYLGFDIRYGNSKN